MKIRLSHSSLSRFQTCPTSYKIRYIDRIVSKSKASSLFFGTAMDNALNHLLGHKDKVEALEEALHVFDENWEQQKDNEGKIVDLPMNPDILYSKYDYDGDLLEKSDWRELFKIHEKPFDARKWVEEELKAGGDWQTIPEVDRVVYNFGSWLSLKRKGKMLIEAYAKQILPQIKEVISVQMELSLDDGADGSITGFIDLIAKLQDGRVALLDNKTSSMEYEVDSVKKSAQLGLYTNILNAYVEDPENPWKTPIDCAGYLVLSKKINKEKIKTCKSCSVVNESTHKTCNAEIDGKRCGGEFDVVKKFSVNTQIIVDNIAPRMLELVMENADVIKANIQAGIFPKNLAACDDQYGKPCEYRNICHNGNMHGLLKLEDKK